MKILALLLGAILLFGLISPAASASPQDVPMSDKAKVSLSDKTSPVKGFEKTKFLEKRDGTNKGFSKKISSKVVQIIIDNNPQERAKELRAILTDNQLGVYVHLKPEFVDNPPKEIKILLQDGSIIATKLPLHAISKIAELDSVERISLVSKVIPLGHAVSEGVAFSFANQLHSAGITGNGITVAIIDDSFFPSNSEISGNVVSQWFDPVTCSSINCDQASGNSHGTAVAEIVVDMAPNVNLRLYAAPDILGLGFNTAVQDAINNNVDIITASLGYELLGGDGTTGFYRDGTSSVAKKINDAKAVDILATIAAGNSGDGHWQGTYTVSPVTPSSIGLDAIDTYQSVMDFRPGESGAQRACLPIFLVDPDNLVTSWNAWDSTNQDYDFFIYTFDMSGIIIASTANQADGIFTEPIEGGPLSIGSGFVCLVIASFSSSQNHFFHVISHNSIFDPSEVVRAGSISTPADAAGALTVGAIDQETDILEDFSSSGPTDDNRNKPEICGPDNTLSHQSGLDPFLGTSSATPHVAGAAALLMEKYPSMNVDQLKSFLINFARFDAGYSVNNLCGADSGAIDLSQVPGPPPAGTEVLALIGSNALGCEETSSCFLPSQYVINQGQTIDWYNEDTAAHTVTSGNPADGPDGIFDSGLFLSGTSFSHTFQASRTIDYFCMVHPWMTGQVVVNAVSCSPPGSGDWTISSSCTLTSSSVAPGNVIIQNNSVLTIPAGMSLDINFVNNYLRVESGSGLLIKAGGYVS